jgi:hypothetical protein
MSEDSTDCGEEENEGLKFGGTAPSRRDFIRVAGALAAATAFSPSVVFGQDNNVNTERKTSMRQATQSSRYERGLATLKKIGGEGYDNILNGLKAAKSSHQRGAQRRLHPAGGYRDDYSNVSLRRLSCCAQRHQCRERGI